MSGRLVMEGPGSDGGSAGGRKEIKISMKVDGEGRREGGTEGVDQDE